MKAMILKEFGKPLVYEEAPEPQIGPRQVLVESKANGLCATDLKIVDGSVKTAPTPLMLGHENSGVVLEVGSEVDSVAPGDRVVVVSKQTCGRCRMCRAGHEEMCLNSPGRLGIEIDGGFGQLVAASERNLVKVGENVSLAAASLIGGTLGSPLHAIRMARPELGECAVIFGVGGLGLHALQCQQLQEESRHDQLAVDAVQRGQGPDEHHMPVGVASGLGRQMIDGLQHGGGSGEAAGVGPEAREAVDGLSLGESVELAAAPVQLHRHVAGRLQARAELRAGAPHPLGHGADLAMSQGVQVHNAVCLAQLPGAQHHRLVAVEAHRPSPGCLASCRRRLT